MAIVSQKCISLAHAIASDLKLSQALTVTESFGTTGLPLIRVGALSSAHPGALIRVQPQSWPAAKDILGLDARIEVPSVVQVCVEANPSGGSGADVSTIGQLGVIIAVAARAGARVEFYSRANGTVPGESDITGTPSGVVDGHPVYGMIGNQ